MPDTTTTTPLDALAALAAETIRLDEELTAADAARHATEGIRATAHDRNHAFSVYASILGARDAAHRTAAPTMAHALAALLPALKEWREALRVFDDDDAHGARMQANAYRLDLAEKALAASIDSLGTGAGAAVPK